MNKFTPFILLFISFIQPTRANVDLVNLIEITHIVKKEHTKLADILTQYIKAGVSVRENDQGVIRTLAENKSIESWNNRMYSFSSG